MFHFHGRRLLSASLLILLSFAVHSVYGQAPAFTKTLRKVNGVNVTTTPSTLANGDLLSWVMTYQYTNTQQPAEADLQDVLSPVLQYVPGSLQAPPAWNRQWFTGAWVTTEPAAATGVGAFIKLPGLVPFGTGLTAPIPTPASGTITTGSSGGGDGYRAIPYGNNIYVINHHTTGMYLDCFNASNGARCAGYKAHVPLAIGSYVSNNNNDNLTPYKTYEYLDRINGKLYFAVEKAAPIEYGILCADLVNKKSCGFVGLATSTASATNTVTFQGIGGVGGRVYMQLPGGRIGCMDTATSAPCPGQPYLVDATATTPEANSSEIVGTRIYSTWRRPSPPYILDCFETSTNAPCTGWGAAKIPDPSGRIGILYPLLSAAGAVTGICAHTTEPNVTGFACYHPASGAPVIPPANYLTWIQTFNGGPANTVSGGGFGQSAYYQARVFNANTVGGISTAVGCYDFAESVPQPCKAPWTDVAGVTQRHYATIADPERPGCLWSYGDDGKLTSFQAADGKPCSGRTSVVNVVKPTDAYCDGTGDVSAWDKLSLIGLTLATGMTATLTLYDGNNPANLAVNGSNVPYAQNLLVSSFPLNLGPGGLNIGYGTGAGKYTSLKVVLQFSGVATDTQWTQNVPPNVELSWVGAQPQFCFQTKVATCDTAPVTNQATAVTKPIGGVQITNTAPTPAFTAVHVLGTDCVTGLTIVKSVVGAPTGFTGAFKFNVTCSTSTGVIQQQLTINWPNTSVSLPGVAAGSTCTVSEDPALPALPAGYWWNGVPVSNPANGVIPIKSGSNQISFVNTARFCEENGRLKITKRVEGAPAPFSGTFTFNVSCWAGSNLTTQQAHITFPGSGTVTLNGIPLGSSCTVTETGPLPVLPLGWFWLQPVYQPASGQASLVGNCYPEVIVIDRPKVCCVEGVDVPVDEPAP